MALTAVDYRIFMGLRREEILPSRPGVLELGEAEWYGDVPAETLADTIDQLTQDLELRTKLHAQLAAALRRESSTWSWDLAKRFYRVVAMIYTELDPVRMVQLPDREKILEMARGGELGRNSLLYAVFAKGDSESEFRIPFQAVYAGGLSPEMS